MFHQTDLMIWKGLWFRWQYAKKIKFLKYSSYALPMNTFILPTEEIYNFYWDLLRHFYKYLNIHYRQNFMWNARINTSYDFVLLFCLLTKLNEIWSKLIEIVNKFFCIYIKIVFMSVYYWHLYRLSQDYKSPEVATS